VFHRRSVPGAPAGALAVLLLAGWLALASGATVARADCLASWVQCQQDTYEPTAATFHSECTTPTMYWGGVDYDVPARTMRLHYDEWMWVGLSLRDEFTLGGPAPGTPVTLHLRIRYHGTAGGYGSGPSGGGVISMRALAPEPGDVEAQKTYGAPYGLSGTMSYSDSLDFFLSRTAGTPVGIELHADATYGYYLDNQMEFVFLDLPPGSNVTSCKGYMQEQPTPALARSWGSLKAAYR
jgi:hypothetical protein